MRFCLPSRHHGHSRSLRDIARRVVYLFIALMFAVSTPLRAAAIVECRPDSDTLQDRAESKPKHTLFMAAQGSTSQIAVERNRTSRGPLATRAKSRFAGMLQELLKTVREWFSPLMAFVLLGLSISGASAQVPSANSRSTTRPFLDPGTSEPPVWDDGVSRGLPASEKPVRYAPWGNGWIVISDPADDPYLPIFESSDPSSVWHRDRPNLFNEPVEDEWDFYNLINTDRPDFTDATYSVGKGVTILESGYTFRYVDDHESETRQTRRSIPEVLFRYGLTNEFELRLKWNGYVMANTHDLPTGLRTQTFGTDDLYLAIKYEVKQQQGWSPMLTFLTGSTIPSGTNGVSSNALQPFVNVVAGWGIRRWLYLKASTGVDWQRISVSTLLGGASEPLAPTVLTLHDSLNLYHGSVSLLYQATKRVGGFIEFFNLSSTGGEDNRPANYIDTGFYIYATPNVQWDIRFGKRLSDRVDELFAGAGFSVRY